MGGFKVHSETEQADILAKKMASGEAYRALYTEGTNMRKWITAIGLEYARLEGYLNYTCEEFSLIETQFLIDEFEFDFGMNSNCFSTQPQGDLQQRISNILTFIAADGTSTAEQFEDLALLLGFTIQVFCCEPVGGFPFTFPITFVDPSQDRFKIFIAGIDPDEDGFTYQFPITFKDAVKNILKCFFDTLKPANCIIVYI